MKKARQASLFCFNFMRGKLLQMEVTLEEAKELLMNHCDRQIKSSVKFFSLFSEPIKITLSFTRIMEPWEKDANLALPPKLFIHGGFIDKTGVCHYGELTTWNEFVLTAIAEHNILKGASEEYDYECHFMGCLKDGEIINEEILDWEKYSNLLRHFVELYKEGK